MADRVQLEACKNARLLSQLCDLLEGAPSADGEDPSGSNISLPCPPAELVRDYDPDVDGWPWETDHL